MSIREDSILLALDRHEQRSLKYHRKLRKYMTHLFQFYLWTPLGQGISLQQHDREGRSGRSKAARREPDDGVTAPHKRIRRSCFHCKTGSVDGRRLLSAPKKSIQSQLSNMTQPRLMEAILILMIDGFGMGQSLRHTNELLLYPR